MTDSRKLDARLGAVLAASAEGQPTLGANAPKGWAERLKTTPHATDEQMAAADERVRDEWRETKARVLVARLPEVYREAEARHPETLAWLAAYRAGATNGFTIMGGHGSGKTWEAMSIARALLVEDRKPVQVTTVPDLLDDLRPGGVTDSAQYKLAPVLVLDDLGTEKLTDWGEEALYQIAGFRASRGLPMVITTNLSGPQVKARYDARLVQRLFGGSSLLDIKGASFRPVPF